VHYPANYGFLPRTYCPDADPLDAIVLGQEPVVPLCILRARAIGVIAVRDETREDDKVIAIHIDDPEYADYEDVADLPPHLVRELEHFFSTTRSSRERPSRSRGCVGASKPSR
jgi:inorganic pyrophosphatase